MAFNLKFKFTDVFIDTYPGNTSIEIIGYLVDTNNIAFLSDNKLDTFTIYTQKTSLPPSGYKDYLIAITNVEINNKYTTSVSATLNKGSKVINVDDTSSLVPNMLISGQNIPSDTTILSIRDSGSVRISSSAESSGQFNLIASPIGWNVDYADYDYLVSVVDFGAI